MLCAIYMAIGRIYMSVYNIGFLVYSNFYAYSYTYPSLPLYTYTHTVHVLNAICQIRARG